MQRHAPNRISCIIIYIWTNTLLLLYHKGSRSSPVRHRLAKDSIFFTRPIFSPSFKYLIVVTTSKHEELIRSYQANIFTKFYLCWNFSSHKIIFFYDVFLTFYRQNNHYCEFRPFDSHLIYLLCYKLIF